MPILEKRELSDSKHDSSEIHNALLKDTYFANVPNTQIHRPSFEWSPWMRNTSHLTESEKLKNNIINYSAAGLSLIGGSIGLINKRTVLYLAGAMACSYFFTKGESERYSSPESAEQK